MDWKKLKNKKTLSSVIPLASSFTLDTSCRVEKIGRVEGKKPESISNPLDRTKTRITLHGHCSHVGKSYAEVTKSPSDDTKLKKRKWRTHWKCTSTEVQANICTISDYKGFDGAIRLFTFYYVNQNTGWRCTSGQCTFRIICFQVSTT